MAVRVEQRGPFAVYRFERGTTQRVTLELPAVVPAEPVPAKSGQAQPLALPERQLSEPL